MPNYLCFIYAFDLHYIPFYLFSCFLQHVDVPVPAPKKDEVLMKLEAISVNPFDWKMQKGVMRPFLPRKFPQIPGIVLKLEIALFHTLLRRSVIVFFVMYRSLGEELFLKDCSFLPG